MNYVAAGTIDQSVVKGRRESWKVEHEFRQPLPLKQKARVTKIAGSCTAPGGGIVVTEINGYREV